MKSDIWELIIIVSLVVFVVSSTVMDVQQFEYIIDLQAEVEALKSGGCDDRIGHS